jgi:phosphatidate cytidylyltransferase
MAYVSGMTCGRRFIQRPFIRFSPNKTWEGFIGGAFFTLIVAWYLSRYLAQYTWMTCPTNEFNLMPGVLHCQVDPIFLPAQVLLPPQVFEIFPRHLVKRLPGVVQICSTSTGTTTTEFSFFSLWPPNQDGGLKPCHAGDQQQVHHHFELEFKSFVPIQLHAIWLGLFASLVAPFGGFLASAIKRAYQIKDFDSIIPGHGGVMDRMDCQFLMALYTWVHYNTFVKLATVSVSKLTYMYSLLSEQEQTEFLETILAARALLPSGGDGVGGSTGS